MGVFCYRRIGRVLCFTLCVLLPLSALSLSKSATACWTFMHDVVFLSSVCFLNYTRYNDVPFLDDIRIRSPKVIRTFALFLLLRASYEYEYKKEHSILTQSNFLFCARRLIWKIKLNRVPRCTLTLPSIPRTSNADLRISIAMPDAEHSGHIK